MTQKGVGSPSFSELLLLFFFMTRPEWQIITVYYVVKHFCPLRVFLSDRNSNKALCIVCTSTVVEESELLLTSISSAAFFFIKKRREGGREE